MELVIILRGIQVLTSDVCLLHECQKINNISFVMTLYLIVLSPLHMKTLYIHSESRLNWTDISDIITARNGRQNYF